MFNKLMLVLSVMFLFFINNAVRMIEPCDPQFEMVYDLSQESCDGGLFQKEGNAIHKCFPQCVSYDSEQPCSEENPCPPGLLCSAEKQHSCIPDPKSCITQVNHSTNPWKDAWKPTCLPDGIWAPKQCKGEASSGRCFCYDEVGNRIFGQAFIDKSENMTCACSRRKTQLRNQGSLPYTTLHCDLMGNYEPLQCDGGHCWCAEPKTGKIISKVVPFSMITFLSCYNENTVGPNYTRQCESDKWAQENLLHEFNMHGTKYINFPHVICDDDGSYGSYQLVDAQFYCKWRDNSLIGSYSSPVDSDVENLNCNCARDTKLFESVGSNQYLVCSSNGNYRPEQYHVTNKKWYCVDQDGFKSSEFFDEQPKNCSIYM